MFPIHCCSPAHCRQNKRRVRKEAKHAAIKPVHPNSMRSDNYQLNHHTEDHKEPGRRSDTCCRSIIRTRSACFQCRPICRSPIRKCPEMECDTKQSVEDHKPEKQVPTRYPNDMSDTKRNMHEHSGNESRHADNRQDSGKPKGNPLPPNAAVELLRAMKMKQ